MKIALCSDEAYPVGRIAQEFLRSRGHEVQLFGALSSGQEEDWVSATEEAASSIASGACDQGVFFCWSGTGAAMAANKVPGVYAALCTDPPTAAAARTWNHANVLCMSNRLIAGDHCKEILTAWLDTSAGEEGRGGADALRLLDQRYRR